MQPTKFEKINIEFGQIVVRGKEIGMDSNIDEDVESFKCDSLIQKLYGEMIFKRKSDMIILTNLVSEKKNKQF
jgi:hypothetical protein